MPKSKQISLVDLTADRIIKYIRENNLEPDDKLPTEQELVELFQVSRSTLREATKLLVSRNILSSIRGSGVFVSRKRGVPTDPLGLLFMMDEPSLILDIINTRMIFEPEIAALAAINATDEQKANIEAACKRVEDLINTNRPYIEEDIAFHHSIAVASANRVIENIVPIIQSSLHQMVTFTGDTLKQETVQFHRKIVDSIIAGDPMGARYAMICHLNINRDFILKKRRQESEKN